MAISTVLADRFDRALLYATHVHGGQVRKGTSTPYVAHLLAVAATVSNTVVTRTSRLQRFCMTASRTKVAPLGWKMFATDSVSE
jgi:(p)ppGpp synthase/HD superfamily hydrolase